MDLMSETIQSSKLLSVCTLIFFTFIRACSSLDFIVPGQTVPDGYYLVSGGGTFELGFFSPGKSKSRYLGIWYKNISPLTVVWVANRETPLSDTRGVLKLNHHGVLLLVNSTNNTIWSSNFTSSRTAAEKPIAQLLNSGNLVVRDGNDSEGNFIWQSFDYPCDTLLPGMKLGWDKVKGLNRFLSSWRSPEDPGQGEHVLQIDRRGFPQSVQLKGSVVQFRAGSWNGLHLTGFPVQKINPIYKPEFVFNQKEVYYKYELMDESIFSRIILNPSGIGQRFVWRGQRHGWEIISANMDLYQGMHKNGICLIGLMAYADLDIRNGGSGCLLWFHDLIDMKQLHHGGQDLYVRVSASEIDHVKVHGYGNINKKELVGITVGSFTLNMGMVLVIFGLCVWKRKLQKPGMTNIYNKNNYYNKLKKEDLDLQIFDLSDIAKATDNFSSSNKLGEGGFGSVYKGILTDGQEIAVKRLSNNSGQGLEELKNEVVLIAKLQHRNLVKLLGCCIQGEEKMLIYEYMLNKSLDYFIFDETRRKNLNWHKRFNIIDGIARGLLYLHQDSRLRIIHRDLKTSNILLDAYLNPKISDFGLARTFWGDHFVAQTNRIAGTYGYMPPEYAMHGHFSMKSDVFSFGVIVLEVVSGRRSCGFSDPEHSFSLPGHAWTLWTEKRPLQLVDEVLEEISSSSDVIRCIQVGLLCVQQRPEDRPDMSSVVLMLNGEKSLPKPKVPAFYNERDVSKENSLSGKFKMFSNNDISHAVLEAR
ncbi:putative serine/threonine-protein kinase [Sesbania bispinosa]|nr:putative serine/threonine-protein kinase [Sesbania bispinosa]